MCACPTARPTCCRWGTGPRSGPRGGCSLAHGIYQGWDLHPAQLPSRYVATFAFFREGLPTAAARLRAYVHGGDSGYLDEPATAVALAGFVLRGVECGALDAAELDELIGIDTGQLGELARRRPAD